MADRLFSDEALAALYDSLCPRRLRADFDFYMPVVMAAEAVLDVGCGTGAMLKEARQLGHKGRLCGLDPAPGMLAQARAQSDVEWVLGDLGSVGGEGEFGLVVMTGHAFQVLLTDDELRVGLAAIRSSLTDGGRFAFETRNPLAREWESWTPDRAVEVADPRGGMVRMAREVVRPFDGNTVSFTHTFTRGEGATPDVSQSTLRFLSRDALASVLERAGFVVEEQFGSWSREPFTQNSPEIITIAKLAR